MDRSGEGEAEVNLTTNHTMTIPPHPYPLFMAACLLVALYMFAALKFPALRWMFRLKRGPAHLAGIDEEANRDLGDALGLVLCPLIGVVALLVFGWLVVQARQQVASKERMAQLADQKARQNLELAKIALGSWPLGKVYHGPNANRGATPEGLEVLANFHEAVASGLRPEHLSDLYLTRQEERPLIYGWHFQLAAPEGPGRAVLRVSPQMDTVYLAVDTTATNRWPVHLGFPIELPPSAREAWAALADLEIIDIR